MSKMPGAKWVGEHGSRPMKAYDIVCAHTIVGHDPAHQAHFSTGNEGLITQSRDTRFQSAANLQGNHRIIAIENEDTPPGWNNQLDFTDAQIDSIAKIIVWCHKTHGIPIVPCPNSKPGSRGIAYHRQGIDGNFDSYAYPGRVKGGELWSEHFGKMCPGDRRIKTLLERIIPLAQKMAAPPKPSPITPYYDGDDDMLLITFPAGNKDAFLLTGGRLVRIKDQQLKIDLAADPAVAQVQNCSDDQWTVFKAGFKIVDA